MKPTNLSSSGAKLQHDLKALRARWEEVQADWDDQVRRDFEAKHLAPLEDRVEAAVRAIDQLKEVLGKMVKELGPDRE